jgi:hypothetical protein
MNQQALYTATHSSSSAVQNALAFQQMQYRAQLAQCSGCAKAPMFSQESGAFSLPLSVEIQDATPGAVIYYTIDGSKPTANSTRYTGPIQITDTTELRAIAIADGGASRIVSSTYRIVWP